MSDVLETLDSWRYWIALGLITWLVVAAFVGVLIGRVIRGRYEQVPVNTASIPTQRRER